MTKHPIHADKTSFRTGLLFIQVVIAAALFLGAFVVYKQLRSLQQADTGIAPRGVLVISTRNTPDVAPFNNI